MKRKIIILSIITIIITILLTAVFIVRGKENIEQKLELGYKYLEEGKYEEAILAFEKIIEIDEANIEAYIGLAEVYITIHEYDEAEEILEDAIDIDDSIDDLWELLIQVNELLEIEKSEITRLYEKAYKKTDDKSFKRWLTEHTPEKPKVNLEGGEYEGSQYIEVLNINEDEIIYYTLDGSNPRKSKIKYDSPIKIEDEDVTLKLLVENEWELYSTIDYTYKIHPSKDITMNGNSLWGGYIVESNKDNIVFIALDNAIYEFNEITKETKKVYQQGYGLVSKLSVYDDELYFIQNGNIFKLDSEIMTAQFVLDIENDISCFYLRKQEIFYSYWNSFNQTIFRYDLSKNNHELIYSFSCADGYFVLYDNSIYVQLFDNYDSGMQIAKIDTNTKNVEALNLGDDLICEDFVLTNGIYYTVKDETYIEKAYFYDLKSNSYTNLSVCENSFNSDAKYLYYLQDDKLMKNNIETGENIEILSNIQNKSKVLLTKEYVYIYCNDKYTTSYSNEEYIYAIKKDASEFTDVLERIPNTTSEDNYETALNKILQIANGKYDDFIILAHENTVLWGKPFYCFEVCENHETHKTNLGWYYVDISTIEAYEYDVINNEYKYIY